MGIGIDRALKIRQAGQNALHSVFDAGRHFGKLSRDLETARHEALANIGIAKAPHRPDLRPFFIG